jgi:hypothetical protein
VVHLERSLERLLQLLEVCMPVFSKTLLQGQFQLGLCPVVESLDAGILTEQVEFDHVGDNFVDSGVFFVRSEGGVVLDEGEDFGDFQALGIELFD